MDVRWLDDVLVLLEERNMTRAAQRRHITQPAFSRRIRSFEDWLGVDILDRQKNRIEINPALGDNEAEIRAFLAHLNELRMKIAHHDPAASVVSIAAQHTAVFSTFPSMALRAKARFAGVRFRIRAGNLSDCVAMFLRGDTTMLLCYQAESIEPIEFGANVMRGEWGHDYLIPVVGGPLRYIVKEHREISLDAPSIVYPDGSFFAEVLKKGNRTFGTTGLSANPFCQTAFASGMKEMVRSGLGVGWLPFSMVHKEIESGEMVSLANQYGQESLDVVIYANRSDDMAECLLGLWTLSDDQGRSF
ncbi:MAG: LysR family transcriptional regulator [Gammaproteobacteria bacterium]|nr:LysR family transcriptional regulator [Gammaproteobacteria bacterium]